MKKLLLLTMLSLLILGTIWSQQASGFTNHQQLAYLNTPTTTFQTPKVKIYPNPATHYIKLSTTQGIRKIKILSLTGKPHKFYEVVGPNQKYNVSDLVEGLYLVQLLDAHNKVVSTKRMNKQ